MENIRYMLKQYDPQTPLYFGHRYDRGGMAKGYMAGGGYVLSKKALSNLIEDLATTYRCHQQDTSNEDVEMGKLCLESHMFEDYDDQFISLQGYCIENNAIFVDDRDEKLEKRFFPVGVEVHFKRKEEASRTFWYHKYMFYKAAQGNLNCCSDKIAQMHYIKPTEMYLIEYLIYRVHPFGLESVNEAIPEKLNISEIMKRSNVESYRRYFMRKNKKYLLEHREDYKSDSIGIENI